MSISFCPRSVTGISARREAVPLGRNFGSQPRNAARRWLHWKIVAIATMPRNRATRQYRRRRRAGRISPGSLEGKIFSTRRSGPDGLRATAPFVFCVSAAPAGIKNAVNETRISRGRPRMPRIAKLQRSASGYCHDTQTREIHNRISLAATAPLCCGYFFAGCECYSCNRNVWKFGRVSCRCRNGYR